MKTAHLSCKTTEEQAAEVDAIARRFGVNSSKAIRTLIAIGMMEIEDGDRPVFENIDALLVTGGLKEFDSDFQKLVKAYRKRA